MKALPGGDNKKGFFGQCWEMVKAKFYPPHYYTAEVQKNNIERQIQSSHIIQENNQEFQRELENDRQHFELSRLKAQHLMSLQRQEFDAEQSSLNRQVQSEMQLRRQDFDAQQSSLNRQAQSEMQLRRQDFDAQQSSLNRQFQADQAKLSQAFQAELTGYIQKCEDARQLKRQDFEKFLLVERQKFDLEMQQRGHEFQIKFALFLFILNILITKWKIILYYYPRRLYPPNFLDSYSILHRNKPVPPLVIISPPEVEFDRFPQRAPQLPLMEKDLEEDLRNFLAQHYPNNHPNTPTQFKAAVWETKRIRAETALDPLFSVLNSVPAIILESEFSNDSFNFRVASWDVGYLQYEYKPILSKFNYREFLYHIAQEQALAWQERRANLLAQGFNLDVVQKLEPDNEFNLQKWHEEQQLKKAGYTPSLDYKVTVNCIKELRHYLGLLHCMFASFAVDEYYFLRYNVTPKLPGLLPGLIQDLPDYEAVNLIQSVVAHYQNFCLSLEEDNQRASSLPELCLDLALGLTHLSDKSWAKEFVIQSMKFWLNQRYLPQPEEFDSLLKAVRWALRIVDVAYVGKLNQCLTAIALPTSLSVIQACYSRGLSSSNQGNYQGAIADFDQAIELNPQLTEAYYYRGLAYSELQQYEKAIADFTTAAQNKPNWPDVYFNRAHAYYKLGEHQNAIADYNQTLKLNPQFQDAMTKREIAQGVWDEKKRQEKVERDRRQSEEEVKGQLFHFEIITVNAAGKEVNRKPGTARQKIETLNGVNLEMVYIPGGTFTMGSPQNEAESNDNEKPQHPVTIQPFFMGKYAVTQAQWKAVTKLPKIQCDLNPDPSRFKGDNRPVENVSWRDAVEFGARLSQKTKRNYRLPSEAEWEYACRAGADTTTPFHFGETITTDLANYDGNNTYANAPKGKYRQETVDVGSFSPNAFGLYQMHGNVWEWCADPWHGNYEKAPTDGSVWDENSNDNRYQNSVDLIVKSGNDNRNRLLRGGSWYDSPWYCRSAIRLNYAPAPRNYAYGFRFVCVAAWT